MTADRTLHLRPDRRVIRYSRDAVGNDLTAVLRWCVTHNDPVWVFGDGSYECPHDTTTRVQSDHELIDAPWEGASDDGT